ncbi:MAG: PP2C family protein-serine/threonine phosphatase [Cryomorphaceae bacterium]|nr:PP2C family protein-serine/threonine phosphatase [Cryomorphaceae bacterium]
MENINHNDDVLLEAGQMLAEPGRDTSRKILIAVNAVFIASLVLFLVIQLINFGTLPDPARDLIFYPLLILINALSLNYNFRVLSGKTQGTIKKDKVTAWASILIAMLMALLIVHASINTAMSMLVDFGFSVILLFVVGTVLGRKTAVIWFIISGLSLAVAYYNIGPGFEYHLLTQEEVTAFNDALAKGDLDAEERLVELQDKRLVPGPILLYFTVWMIFMIFAFLAVYFESNMISRVLNVIPTVIEKINIANEEKMQLKNENMRMGMELDVARKIQLMMLPNEQEFVAQIGIEVAARMDPASEVGGDFYEFLPQKDKSAILAIGDVTDHGLQSGLVMLMAQSITRATLDDHRMELPKALNRINTILYRNIRNRMEDFRNLTMILARIEEDKLTVCGQHENILYFDAEKQSCKMISTEDLGIYIGLIEDVGEHLREQDLPLNHGDLYFFYTDGLTEAEDPDGAFYGEDRLMEVFENNASKGPKKLLKAIYDDVYQFVGKREIMDDITAIAFKKNEKPES